MIDSGRCDVTAEELNKQIRAETSRGGKYLTFTLGNEEYGVGILKVREIIGILDITEIPRMPDYVKGVINLRGKVSPVIDLRLKFAMPRADYTSRTCIILMEIDKEETTALMGIIVDSVSEVMNVNAHDIEDTPEVRGANTDYILGIAKKDKKVIMLLDIDKALNDDEIVALEAVA
ncbi:MAG: chemotaxis protein CheW [Proteobacteria bacterium]|nr:chemotaxis protein CheW [Pseudomonadota bacterium]MBU1738022.1 chemotaxis protein CheW [Pseudomonadota bacterium]